MTYKEYYEKKRVKIAAKYESAVDDGNMAEAYKILGDMMRFKFIHNDDVRLSKDSIKEFEKAGIDTENKFDKDYRKDSDFLPDNLFMKVPVCETVELTSGAHWGKRLELSYEGDIIIPEKKYEFSIIAKTSSATLRGALSRFKDLYREESGMSMDMDEHWIESLDIGKSVLYEVALANGQQFLFNNLGFIYATIVGNKVRLTVLLSNKGMLKTHINIKRAYEVVADVLKSAFIGAGASSEDVQVKFMCNIKVARDRQTKEYSKQPPLNYDKFCEIENRKIAEAEELKANECYTTFVE